MGIECKNCKDDFLPERIDQVFCCASCRRRYHNQLYQEKQKPFKEAVRNLKEQDYKLAALFLDGYDVVETSWSDLRKLGIDTVYAKTIQKDQGRVLAYDYVHFGLKRVAIGKFIVYKIKKSES